VSIATALEDYHAACARLRTVVDLPVSTRRFIEAEAEVERQKDRILAIRPATRDEMLRKLGFVELLVGGAIGDEGPGEAWFNQLRKDLLVLTR
jgi:hypothetical protein